MRDQEELINELAKIGLRKLMQTNVQAQFRIQEAQRKLAEKQADEMLAISILGNPVEEDRAQVEAREKHREHMRAQRQQQEFEPIAVDSYMTRAR
jgi:hypothetical protein